MAAWLIGLPVLYVASFGPACWLASQVLVGGVVYPHPMMVVCYPLGRLTRRAETHYGQLLCRWMTLGLPKGRTASVPANPDGTGGIGVRS